MKIAYFIVGAISKKSGGCEKYFIESVENLSKFKNIQVDLIAIDDDFSHKVNKLISFYYFTERSPKNCRASIIEIKEKIGEANYYKCSSLRNLQKKLNEYDVIYSKNEILEAFFLKFLIGYKNLPSIISGCHTPIYYPITKSVQSKLHNILYNGFVYKFLASGVKKFHVINSFDEKQFKKIFPQKEIIKIYNPFDFNEFIQKAEKYKFNFSWNKSKFNILWTGKLTEQKGINDLIKIINEINKTEYKNKIVWNIAGEGKEKQKIKILDLEKKWDNINYFGYVENKYIASIYKASNLFISTSKWEGFPYNLLEAQSFGLPVISYNINGCNDIIEDNKNGFLVNNLEQFKDRILFFIKGSKLETDIAKFIRYKFNKNSIYKDLINMFKNYV